MTRQLFDPGSSDRISRRKLLKQIGAVAGAASLGRVTAAQQAQAPTGKPVDPPSTITNPPREFGPNAPPTTYPDPDVLVLDPSFNRLRTFNSPITRLWTGALWSEGPAWNSQGQYLVWSDIPNNRQLRWLNDDGRVTVFRQPSNNSNGNTFDFQGRQVSCEHLTRRVVRYENDGSITVLADAYQGTHLIGPNDVAAHPDGSYWFTDLGAGGQLYEGTPDVSGGFSNKEGRLNPRLGQPPEIGTLKRELPSNVYRVDAKGRVDLVVSEKQIGGGSNGITFSPDYKKLYLVRGGDVYSFDVGPDNKVSNQKQFLTMTVDGVRCGTDGIRCDVEGNLWCSSNAGRNVGYSGVTVWNPAGQLIGRIRLPEVCGNLAFGGPERNRLFMVASASLYAVYLNTQGAAPG
jgi:gluconolactonase